MIKTLSELTRIGFARHLYRCILTLNELSLASRFANVSSSAVHICTQSLENSTGGSRYSYVLVSLLNFCFILSADLYPKAERLTFEPPTDPNIPFVPEITPDIPYGDPGLCYDLCQISDNLNELITDSLSKYEIDKCPTLDAIAYEVHKKTNNKTISESKHPDQVTTDSTPDLETDYDGRIRFTTNKTQDNSKMIITQYEVRGMHVHEKKMSELKGALTIYKNQPKVHHFGGHSDHSSIAPSQSEPPT